MKEIRINLPTLVLLLAVAAGAAFAAGSALPTSVAAPTTATPVAAERAPEQGQEPMPPGHPPVNDPISEPTGAVGDLGDNPAGDEASLEWKASPRWQLVANASTMRLATYRVPHAPGDATDAELAITRAGGSADANAERWIHQFDDEGQKTAKR